MSSRPRYSERFPNVRVILTEALGHEQLTLLERGEVHLGIRHDQSSDRRFGSRALPPDEVLAACALSQQLGSASMIDIGRLVRHPLLLLDSGYSVRKMFDAACRLAEVEPKVLVESRAPHTLLALAEAGHGVAIIPSILATDRYILRIVRVAHRRKPLRERLVIQWDKRRLIPSNAEHFCDLLAEYMSEILPSRSRRRAKIPLHAAEFLSGRHGSMRDKPAEMSALGLGCSLIPGLPSSSPSASLPGPGFSPR